MFMLSQNMFELALLAVQKRFNLLHDNLGSKNQETMVNQSINEFRLAQRDLPVIKINSPDDEDGQGGNDSEEEDIDNSVTTQFSEKANSLLAYIDKTYLLVIILFLIKASSIHLTGSVSVSNMLQNSLIIHF